MKFKHKAKSKPPRTPIAWVVHHWNDCRYLVFRDLQGSSVAISAEGVGNGFDSSKPGIASGMSPELIDAYGPLVVKRFYQGDEITLTLGFDE